MRNDPIADFYRGWNERDASAVADLFVDDGTLLDPLCRAPLSGDARRAHLATIIAALPELKFTVLRTVREGGHVVVSWSLAALCKGALDPELVADGVSFTLEGIDWIELDEHGIRSVRRIFDRRDLAERLGLQSIVEPIEVGSMSFGYSLRDWVSTRKPALLGMTWIQARDEAEKAKIRGYSRSILKGFRDVPGFIGVVTGFAGLHGFTFTAWESEDALRAGVHGTEHVEAMRGFHRGTSSGVFTSVWQPLRLNRMWLRCLQCGAANDAESAERRCSRCGTPLPDAPPYV